MTHYPHILFHKKEVMDTGDDKSKQKGADTICFSETGNGTVGFGVKADFTQKAGEKSASRSPRRRRESSGTT
jgi:hypothetical protein